MVLYSSSYTILVAGPGKNGPGKKGPGKKGPVKRVPVKTVLGKNGPGKKGPDSNKLFNKNSSVADWWQYLVS